MKCQCGKEFRGVKKPLNQHRQHCDAFWRAVKQEMERISTKLRGKVTPISTYEWDMYRTAAFPTKRTLIDWRGSWSNVQNNVGLGLSRSGPRTENVTSIIPAIDEFIETILDLSDEYYGNGDVMGCALYDDCRPGGWPTYRTAMKLYGYDENRHGWRQFFQDHGYTVISGSDALLIAYEAKATEQAKRIEGFDYRNPQDEKYIAVTYDPGFAICQATYERTGRMILR